MSKHNHNYSQYSNKNKQNYNKPIEKPVEQPVVKTPEIKPEVKPVVTPELVKEPAPVVRPELVKETVETVALSETVEGFVVNCAKLNVRESATIDSAVVCVLNVLSEIRVDVNKSTNKWVYVYTATGLEGYCMREYIDARL